MSTWLSSTLAELEKRTEPPTNKTKMDYLLLALWIMNPHDMDPPEGVILPKPPIRKSYLTKKNRMKKMMQRDHTYSASLARKICSGCNKTCRYKRLIQCDYCPLAYHQSCLNPPTTLPNGSRWMCPNHPQYLIDCVAALAAREQSARNLPVDNVALKENVIMGTVVMEVGTAEGCELRLDAAECRRVSRNHAAIYMNHDTSEFKLINYSKYGSSVIKNGEVINLSAAQYLGPDAMGEARAPSPLDLTMPVSNEHPCCCQPRVLELTHGASTLLTPKCLLEFGCQIYSFTIIDTDIPQPVSLT